ncbi:hypothetical protein HJG60_012167 [Phyllostomus discolor]|uniref:Uncharacterized protein n=1 Tax=Phyllostomus discolor TaxID=89673 RepID=A0A833ZDQ8_9CHIR|nr:hypothetical protein HJG60_012167 [Phyllostomus discolor]
MPPSPYSLGPAPAPTGAGQASLPSPLHCLSKDAFLYFPKEQLNWSPFPGTASRVTNPKHDTTPTCHIFLVYSASQGASVMWTTGLMSFSSCSAFLPRCNLPGTPSPSLEACAKLSVVLEVRAPNSRPFW